MKTTSDKLGKNRNFFEEYSPLRCGVIALEREGTKGDKSVTYIHTYTHTDRQPLNCCGLRPQRTVAAECRKIN